MRKFLIPLKKPAESTDSVGAASSESEHSLRHATAVPAESHLEGSPTSSTSEPIASVQPARAQNEWVDDVSYGLKDTVPTQPVLNSYPKRMFGSTARSDFIHAGMIQGLGWNIL